MMAQNDTLSVQLAKEYQQGAPGSKKDTSPYKQPPIHWIMSEKFDGYRALFYYDEEGIGTFVSRAGKPFLAPEWFLKAMPPQNLLGTHILDGELWAGRDNFQLMGTVRKKVPMDEEWMQIQYQVYDITNITHTFVKRLGVLHKMVNACDTRWKIIKKAIGYPYHNLDSPIVYASQTQIKSVEQMKEYYDTGVAEGGEGIMMKHPTMPYEKGRSSYLLKYKPVYDREAIIVDYKLGNGKYKGLLGAFICKPLINHDTYSSIDEDPNHQFTLSGMDDEIRKKYLETHPLQTIISYECSGYTNKGVPRFGRYLRKREDIVLKEASSGTDGLKKVMVVFNALESHCKENDDTFRLKSYRRANACLRKIQDDSQLTDGTLSQMEGIGSGTMDKIRQILETGTCPSYEKIKNTVDSYSPKAEFLKIHGVGSVQANKLVKAGFKSIDELRRCDTIRTYLNDVQMMGLHYFDDIQARIPYEEIVDHETFLKQMLHQVDPNAELTIAGSYRRKKPDSGDIDLLVKGKTRKTYENFIQLLEEKRYLICTLAKGTKKYMGLGQMEGYSGNRRIDIMYTKPDEYPCAILYFTGSSEFNQRMRKEILDRGLSINEYSLKDNETKEKVKHVFHTERDIFDYLGYEYVEPELRKE